MNPNDIQKHNAKNAQTLISEGEQDTEFVHPEIKQKLLRKQDVQITVVVADEINWDDSDDNLKDNVCFNDDTMDKSSNSVLEISPTMSER